jgi:hypothetical protein
MVVQYREMEKEGEEGEMMSKMGEGESDTKTWAEEMALFSSKNEELLASCEEAILDEVQTTARHFPICELFTEKYTKALSDCGSLC